MESARSWRGGSAPGPCRSISASRAASGERAGFSRAWEAASCPRGSRPPRSTPITARTTRGRSSTGRSSVRRGAREAFSRGGGRASWTTIPSTGSFCSSRSSTFPRWARTSPSRRMADPSDGWFDVVTAGRRRAAAHRRIPRGAAKAAREPELDLPTRRARRAEVTGWERIHVDDELRRIAEAGKVTLEIEPGAIELLVRRHPGRSDEHQRQTGVGDAVEGGGTIPDHSRLRLPS